MTCGPALTQVVLRHLCKAVCALCRLRFLQVLLCRSSVSTSHLSVKGAHTWRKLKRTPHKLLQRLFTQQARRCEPCTPAEALGRQLALGSRRSKVELLKEDSDYLRHPLMEELVSEATNINEEAAQLMKFHGSYQQDDREQRGAGKVSCDRRRALCGVIEPAL